jgi:hypothetical protein
MARADSDFNRETKCCIAPAAARTAALAGSAARVRLEEETHCIRLIIEDEGMGCSEKPCWVAVRSEQSDGLLVKGDEGFAAQPGSFIRNDAIGEVAVGFEQ